MLISNPFQPNDWNIKKFLIVILSLQLAIWGVISLGELGFQIPILRQIIGFIYLTFIPGILVLRILKIHKISSINVILYAAGLSIAILMFVTFFMNTLYPLFGISRPISLWSLLITISGIVIGLSILAYIRDRSFFEGEYIDLNKIPTLPILVLSLLFFCTILGTYLMNYYSNNFLLISTLLIIAFIPVFVIFTRFIPENYYPYTIFIAAVALLYHQALITNYISGWDIQYEFYLTSGVIQNALWDSSISNPVNAMLSLTMLGPIYTIVGFNTGLEWVFKIIYPLIYAFVPLGLYAIYKQQTDGKIAFLSCFFFMSVFTFYTEMLGLARQEIAEFFLVLIILSTFDKNLNKNLKLIFFLIFSSSLIVSHYGLSYLFMFILILAWVMTTIDLQKYILKFSALWEKGIISTSKFNQQKDRYYQKIIPFFSIIWYVVFILVWYIYTAGSSSIISVVRIGQNITTGILSEFSSKVLNPETTQGLALITYQSATFLHEITKYLHLLTIFFIIIGFVFVIFKIRSLSFDIHYVFLSFGAIIICMSGVVLPFFASALNTTRIYHISLLLLAPFCVIGGMAIYQIITKIMIRSWSNQVKEDSLRILSVIFAVFFLFNSGWVYEIAKDNPTSRALNRTLDGAYFNTQEVSGAKWLSNVKGDKSIYADENRKILLHGFEGVEIRPIIFGDSGDPGNSYIFLGTRNIKDNIILIGYKERSVSKFYKINTTSLINSRNRIYDNNAARFYL